MRVVSIDPHPAKDSVVCLEDGSDRVQFLRKTPAELRAFLNCLAKTEVLLCWDAPLTGPKLCGSNSGVDFYWRPIECFFARQERVGAQRKRNKTHFEVPRGVSVLPYAGCAHWTITRSLLGLPRVGPFDHNSGLPFDLLTDPRLDPRSVKRASVVEVHPGVAGWLWCREQRCPNSDWQYKKKPAIRASLWEIIRRHWKPKWGECPRPSNDDKFDAAIGYMVGRLWLDGDSAVGLIGGQETGAWLLPAAKELAQAWEEFGSNSQGKAGK